MIRICLSGEVETPHLPSGSWIPDVNIRVEVAAAGYKLAAARCKMATAGCKLAVAGCKLAAARCKSYPDMWSERPPMVHPDALSGYTPCMDSKELSSISYFFGDQKAIKTPKLNTIWLEFIARVLNMLIGLKGDNYYSKVFKRVNYKLWNITFWVVITWVLSHKWWMF